MILRLYKAKQKINTKGVNYMRYVVTRQGFYFREVFNSAGEWVMLISDATVYTNYNIAWFVASSRGGKVVEME